LRQFDFQVRPKLPDELIFLLKDFPRENWADHPNFGHFTRYWLDSHQMFRQIASLLGKVTESYLSKNCSAQDFAERFAQNGNQFLSHLHNHHTIEDQHFFPEIRQVEKRFDLGLETLEKDHAELSELLEELAKIGNGVIGLLPTDQVGARSEAGFLYENLAKIDKNLDRHLTDEEDLIMPILLLHKLRE